MTKTMSLRKYVREMELKEGDTFIVTGYSNRTNLGADMLMLRKELGIEMKISQHEVMLVDHIAKTAETAWIITIAEGNNFDRTFKKRGRKKKNEQ